MINYIKKMNKMTLYIILVSLLYILLIIASLIFNKERVEYSYTNFEYKKTNIFEETENYKIDVNYPRFRNEKLSSIITDYLYKYVGDFKKTSKDKEGKETLIINYELNKIDGYMNIFFSINNTLKPNDKYKSILVDNKEKVEVDISKLYGENILNEIKDMINKKYPEFVYKEIEEYTLKDFSYEIKEDYVNIYINKEVLKLDVNYELYVTKILKEDYVKPVNKEENKKYIAFTFDDGPSEYTTRLVDAFVMNDSKGTFFMLGSRMKNNEEIVRYVSDNNMEVGSHSYSHKYLTSLSDEELLEEINSVTILYKEITGKDINLLRPPYGSIDNKLQEMSMFPLVTWSIDPYDWLHKDKEFVKNHILSHAYDGAIVIMHDLYETTIEAVKELIPELKASGYELVTVSELAKIKGKTLTPGEIIKEIK